jgi:hypothetical protein
VFFDVHYIRALRSILTQCSFGSFGTSLQGHTYAWERRPIAAATCARRQNAPNVRRHAAPRKTSSKK